MKLSTVMKDGFPVSEDESPKIIGPHQVEMKAHPGQQLILHCKAFANSEADETIIYWLVNGSFPEDAASRGRIVEAKESILEDGAIIQRSLTLKKITLEDLKSTFTCVVTNAAGAAKQETTLIYNKSSR